MEQVTFKDELIAQLEAKDEAYKERYGGDWEVAKALDTMLKTISA